MDKKRPHGGKREGAGRKSRFGERMVQTTVRLPPDVKARLIEEYGSVQAAIDELVIEPFLKPE